MNKRERRYIPATELRVQQQDGQKIITGTAVVYNSLSEDMGFREMISPGAFKDCLSTNPDVRCLFNHDESRILGRTIAETLELTDDDRGLHFRCILPDTSVGRDLAVSIDRGDVSQCSFGFMCEDDEWTETNDYMLRTVKVATLFDVSPVTFPAYTATSVGMRSLFPDGDIQIPERKKVEEKRSNTIGCECACDQCQEDRCEECSMDPCNDSNCRCQDNRLLAMILERRTR